MRWEVFCFLECKNPRKNWSKSYSCGVSSLSFNGLISAMTSLAIALEIFKSKNDPNIIPNIPTPHAISKCVSYYIT